LSADASRQDKTNSHLTVSQLKQLNSLDQHAARSPAYQNQYSFV